VVGCDGDGEGGDGGGDAGEGVHACAGRCGAPEDTGAGGIAAFKDSVFEDGGSTDAG
jgi:hypothetical protein